MMSRLRHLNAIADLEPGAWDSLFRGGNPFVRHAFLEALEASGSVGGEAGWQPRHLVLEDKGQPVAAMPLYAKDHSYGEFVFDWSWAQAYRRHGLPYYPKLVTAVPFTPSAGPRIGLAAGQDGPALAGAMLRGARELARAEAMSGWHLLFPDQHTQDLLGRHGDDGRLLAREDVQFHWRNRGYEDFDGFLAGLRSSRRKNIRRERRQVAAQGVSLERAIGDGIGDAEWAGFYVCYVSTYLKRSGHGGYLNREFFNLLRATLACAPSGRSTRGSFRPSIVLFPKPGPP